MSELISTVKERITNVSYNPTMVTNFQSIYELTVLVINYTT